MAIYNVHAGHCPQGNGAYGACGVLLESVEDRIVKNEVIRLLRGRGHTVYDCTDETNCDMRTNLARIVAKCNAHAVDLDISIHLNSGRGDSNGDGYTGGVEVWNYSNKTASYSDRICNNVSKALGIKNRGTKYSTQLYVLRRTTSPALLVECCFVDDKDDADRWDAKKCAKAIVEGVLNMSVGGWTDNGFGWWYDLGNGKCYKNEWQKIDGVWYYFDANGYAVKNDWKKIKGLWYHFDSNCHMETGWIKIGKLWYYLEADGHMRTGWLRIKDTWFYLNKDGAMQTGWQKIDGLRYYFNESGYMLTGWLKYKNQWYYLANLDKGCKDGQMVTDAWILHKNSWYRLKHDGTLVTDTSIEFSFDENGVAKEVQK